MLKRTLSLALVMFTLLSSIGITGVFAEEAANSQDSVVLYLTVQLQFRQINLRTQKQVCNSFHVRKP